MHYLLLIFLACTVIPTGNALTCYGWAAQEQSNGDDPFDETNPTVQHLNCDEGLVCAKQTMVFPFGTTIQRGCMDPLKIVVLVLELPTRLTIEDLAKITNYRANFCATNLCNGATSISVALVTLISAAILLLVQHSI